MRGPPARCSCIGGVTRSPAPSSPVAASIIAATAIATWANLPSPGDATSAALLAARSLIPLGPLTLTPSLAMDPGWLILFSFMLIEAFIVLLLVMPMPSNHVRGAITASVTALWEKQPAIRYIAVCLTLINGFYFWHVIDALLDPFRVHFGIFGLNDPLLTCEMRATNFERERNAYITGFSLFLFLVLRRLVDIQVKLHEARADSKSVAAGVPMGQPVPPAVRRSKFD